MRPLTPWRRASSPAARRAFTLVELVTAASLMTIIMLGVIEIFSIVTQTASDAEGVIFAQEQARAFFDRLHNELRGMTREGYLRIVHNTIAPTASSPSGTPYTLSSPSVPATGVPGTTVDTNGTKATSIYGDDSLAFVTLGMFPPTFAASAPNPSVAEVLYTNNVNTNNTILKVEAGGYPQKSVDPRRGVLAHGQWLLTPTLASLPSNVGDNSATSDQAWGRFLSEWMALQPTKSTASAAASVWPPTVYDRINKAPGGTSGYLQVAPWITQLGKSDNPSTLKRVVASCCSEFYVEVYDPAGATDVAGTSYGAGVNAFTSGARINSPATTDPPYFWSTNQFPSSTIGNNNSGIRTWPKAIRVTIALHDPSDRKPLDPPVNSIYQRYRGIVMQETFWITDP